MKGLTKEFRTRIHGPLKANFGSNNEASYSHSQSVDKVKIKVTNYIFGKNMKKGVPYQITEI